MGWVRVEQKGVLSMAGSPMAGAPLVALLLVPKPAGFTLVAGWWGMGGVHTACGDPEASGQHLLSRVNLCLLQGCRENTLTNSAYLVWKITNLRGKYVTKVSDL